MAAAGLSFAVANMDSDCLNSGYNRCAVTQVDLDSGLTDRIVEKYHLGYCRDEVGQSRLDRRCLLLRNWVQLNLLLCLLRLIILACKEFVCRCGEA